MVQKWQCASSHPDFSSTPPIIFFVIENQPASSFGLSSLLQSHNYQPRLRLLCLKLYFSTSSTSSMRLCLCLRPHIWLYDIPVLQPYPRIAVQSGGSTFRDTLGLKLSVIRRLVWHQS
ncbi:hypothetical protein BDZ45DRAFT_678857 [Acephala macrosclerotiorum]|nr:hypothetical protein BDZ45DRAFT_678857 [Acephala macrosclerotiorum]